MKKFICFNSANCNSFILCSHEKPHEKTTTCNYPCKYFKPHDKSKVGCIEIEKNEK